jgi:hypothetical protein
MSRPEGGTGADNYFLGSVVSFEEPAKIYGG